MIFLLALIVLLGCCACGNGQSAESPYEKYAKYEDLFECLEVGDLESAQSYLEDFFGVTLTPTVPATQPTELTQPPTEVTQPPTEPTQPPTEPTQPDTVPAEPPTEPTEPPTEPTDPTQVTEPQEDPMPTPEDLPSSVEIPTETDPDTGANLGISFPCQVPGYGLVIEKLAPYSGMFVEDGTNSILENVAMLMVHNNGDFPVEYTQLRVLQGDEELLFDISALPVGERVVVQEKNGKTIEEGKTESASALVVQRANMEMSEDKVRVIDNGDNTLTVENLTDEMIPTVRVFYKYYMQDEGLFVGGIAFTVRISRLGAGARVTIQPSHYTSQTSRVVMVLTYDSEV